MDHEKYMRLALIEAKKAAAAGEIPVGAVVVCGNTVLAAALSLIHISEPTRPY